MTIDAILNLGPVMPVIVIDEADKAVPAGKPYYQAASA